MQELPPFRQTKPGYAHQYAQRVFGDALHDVLPQEGGYFRALFTDGYFTIQPGNDVPSKSQWSTLKKRMKRIHRGVFVLRESGETTHEDETFYYLDFGFLPE